MPVFPGYVSDRAAFLRMLESELCTECKSRFAVVLWVQERLCGRCACDWLGWLPALAAARDRSPS